MVGVTGDVKSFKETAENRSWEVVLSMGLGQNENQKWVVRSNLPSDLGLLANVGTCGHPAIPYISSYPATTGGQSAHVPPPQAALPCVFFTPLSRGHQLRHSVPHIQAVLSANYNCFTGFQAPGQPRGLDD